MLPKKYRLSIQKFLKNNHQKVVRSKYFAIKFKSNNLSFSRFGIVISNKVSKSAVKRNKIKRIIFDFFRLKEYYLKLKTGKDVLIIVSTQVNKLTKVEIERELENVFS
ncbi:MAG: ribonuclease P protein component [Candidatus Paceibacterota bacterium]